MAHPIDLNMYKFTYKTYLRKYHCRQSGAYKCSVTQSNGRNGVSTLQLMCGF